MDAIAAQLSALAPSINPYLALAATLQSQLVPPAPNSFRVGLDVARGFFAIATILAITVIALRRASGALWWYRLRATPAGTLFVPNAALWWLCSFILYSGIVQGLIQLTRNAYFDRTTPIAITKQLDAVGLIVLSIGLWFNAYEMAAAVFARYSASFTRFRAWHLHALFAIVPFFELVVLVVLLISAHRLEKTNDLLDTAVRDLAAVPWSVGQAFAVDMTAPWFASLIAFQAQAADFIVLEKVGYGLIAGDMIANSMVVVPATILQVRVLRKHANASSKAVAAFLTQHKSATTLLHSRSWAMRTNIFALAAEASSVAMITLAVCIISAWVAIQLDAVIASGINLAVAYLTVFFSVSILIIPVHGLLLFQALRAYRRSRKHGNSSASHSGGLTITTETKIEIDDSFGTRSFDSTVDAHDHVGIALMAMNAERTGLATRTNLSAQASLNSGPVEVFVLPRPLPPPKGYQAYEIGLDDKTSSPRSVKFHDSDRAV